MIWKQFTHLGNFPPELKSRFNSFLTTEFDDSLSVEMQLRSIIKWCQGNFKTVDTLIDFINDISNWLKQFENNFDTKLEDSVISILSEWQASGQLDVVISEALQWQLDDYIATNEQDKLSLTAQLQQTKQELNAQLQQTEQHLNAKLADVVTLVSSFKLPTDIDDTPSISKALAYVNTQGGGKVRIPWKPTPYILSSTPLIYSNTHLEVDEFAVIKLANNANCRMLENANKTTQSSLTRVDHHIKITGGIWDGNGTNQSKKWDGEANTSSLMTGFLFSGIDKFEFSPTKIINTKTYGVLICNVRNLLIENTEVYVGDVNNPNNGDGIHILGPAESVTIQNCKLHSEDNVIAINADDVGHGIYGTFGDITDVKIKNIELNNHDGGQGILLLSATHKVSNVTIDGITGKCAYLLNLNTFDLGPGDYDNLIIQNINMERKDPLKNNQMIRMVGKFGRVSFRNIVITGNTQTNPGARFLGIYMTPLTPQTTIDNLSIDNMSIDKIGGDPAVSSSLIYVNASVVINNLSVNNLFSKNNIQKCIPLNLYSCIIGYLDLSNIICDNLEETAIKNVGTSIAKLRYDNQPWQPAELKNNWINYGGGFADASYYKDKYGVVHLKGLIKGGVTTADTELFTLPLSHRIAESTFFTVYSNDTFGSVLVAPSGKVLMRSGSNISFSLDGISFRALNL